MSLACSNGKPRPHHVAARVLRQLQIVHTSHHRWKKVIRVFCRLHGLANNGQWRIQATQTCNHNVPRQQFSSTQVVQCTTSCAVHYKFSRENDKMIVEYCACLCAIQSAYIVSANDIQNWKSALSLSFLARSRGHCSNPLQEAHRCLRSLW